jgi:hypothetical protein
MPSHATTKEIAARSPLSGRPVGFSSLFAFSLLGLLLLLLAREGERLLHTRRTPAHTHTRRTQRERCALFRDPEEVFAHVIHNGRRPDLRHHAA